MAAYRAGITTVVLPQENMPDLAEVDEKVRASLEFVPAKHMETVLETALQPAAVKSAAANQRSSVLVTPSKPVPSHRSIQS